METITVSDAKARVLEAAERLFHTRGYKAITLRDIAGEVGLNHASLYHHVPGGKEALFVEVMQRAFARHQAHLDQAILEAGPNLREQLRAASRWMLSQTPIDFMRMMLADMPALGKATSKRLGRDAYEAFLRPFESAFVAAHKRGEIRMVSSPTILAGAFLSIVQSAHAAPIATDHTPLSKESMIDELIDVMLFGLSV
jgi:TetR/AcrR family transcriptional regulator, cholesterol catabolism regulator